ncbi:MAG: cation diffusion facilitator family transporter, partial [Nanoarchaeota archaeon]|nr:cation diffusion facilitator family transporter [Nanoarchaeota archaeon]
MKKEAKNASLLLILGNTLLFILKIIVGIMSNSIAIISDAVNSFTDIIASFVVFFCVKKGSKKADRDHPFGHHRIEPIAGLIVAIFIAIVGFEVLKESAIRLWSGEVVIFSYIAVAVLIFTMILKTFMFFYLKKVSNKINSPAIYASSVDCRNDIFISGAALLGLVGYHIGYTFLDSLAGLLIGGWIVFAGYEVGRSNIDYLIGKSPEKKVINQIKKVALNVKGVKGLNDVKAHYVGNYVHVEIHIELNKKLTLVRAHNLGKEVEKKIEGLDSIH